MDPMNHVGQHSAAMQDAALHLRQSDELALVIAWSADAPHRVGEVAFLSAQQPLHVLGAAVSQDAERARSRALGRQLIFFRHRPAGVRDRDPLPTHARETWAPMFATRLLELRPLKHAVFVKNVGAQPAFINGSKLFETPVVPGDILYLEDRLVLYCTRRPLQLPPLQHYPVESAPFFGMPDAAGLVGESPAIWAARECMAGQADGCVQPPLSQRMEDVPLLIHHILRSQAQRDDLDLSRFFRDGLPRLHPLFIVQILQRSRALQHTDLPELIQHALACSHGHVIGPLADAAETQAAPRARSQFTPRMA